MPKKALIISIKHLGDVVTTTVLIPMLKGRFPGIEVHYLVNPEAAHLVDSHPEVARVWTAPRRAGLRGFAGLVRGLRRERFDYSFDVSEGDRSAALNLLAGARLRLAYLADRKYFLRNLASHSRAPSWKDSPGRPVTEFHADLARAAGCPDEAAPYASLGVSEGGRREAEALLARRGAAGLPYAVCHFTARDAFRQWPPEHCADAVRFLRTRLGPVFLATSGEGPEAPFVERIVALSGGGAFSTAGTGLAGLMALVAGSRGVLGLDSLVVHLAGAYGIPVVGIYGPSREANWSPKGPWVRAAHMDLPCRSCVTGGCLEGGLVSRCLKEMDFETYVRPHLEALLEARPSPVPGGALAAAGA
jgi:ADP-heptose:LPS heptosyltransferase